LSAAPTRRTRGDAGEPHLAHTVWCVEGGIPAVLARNQLHWLLPRRDERRAVVPVQSAARVRGDERRRARTVVASCASAQRRAAWQVYLNSLPLPPDAEPLDWRYHAVWLYPLVLTAVAPFVFHPYLIGGPDLPRGLARRRRRASSHAPTAGKHYTHAASARTHAVSRRPEAS